MITIHMTTHRRLASGLLQRAVESVLSQDFTDFEFVVCDDASVDGTAAYLHRVAAADRRVRVFHNETNVNSVAISLGRCLQQSDPTGCSTIAYCCRGIVAVQKNRRSGVCCR